MPCKPRLARMKKLLIIDDDAVSRELTREILQSPALQVLEASNGSDALKVLAESKPDLVLLDIRMPFNDGYDIIRDIRKNPNLRSMRVVAFTASAMHGEREKALAAGFDEFLTKPISLALLSQQIAQLLSD